MVQTQPETTASGGDSFASPSGPGLDFADLACIRAAKPRGLVYCQKHSYGAPTGGDGWRVRATWDGREGDVYRGGPWSHERVFRLAEMALLSIDYGSQRCVAVITTEGRRLLRTVGDGVGYGPHVHGNSSQTNDMNTKPSDPTP